MSYKYSFADNEVYSAGDINAITKRLVTSGISDPFSDGVPYNISKFNEAGKLLYTSGIVPETCLTLKVEQSGEGKIIINPGVAFFEDGSVIEIEAGGEVLSYATGAKNYVYLKNDLLNTNTSYPCCTTDEPIGDYVLLAEIDEAGMVSDKRTYAKGKLPGYQSVSGEVMNLKEKVIVTAESITGGKTHKNFDIGNNDYRYILAITKPEGEEFGAMGVYDIKSGEYLSFFGLGGNYYGNAGVVNSGVCTSSKYPDRRVWLKFSLADGVLSTEISLVDVGSFSVGQSIEIDIDLVLF